MIFGGQIGLKTKLVFFVTRVGYDQRKLYDLTGLCRERHQATCGHTQPAMIATAHAAGDALRS